MYLRVFLMMVSLLAIAVISACGSSSDNSEPGGSSDLGNIAGIVTSGTSKIGVDTGTALSTLRKLVPLTLVNPNGDFVLGNTYVSRNTPSSTSIYWMTEVSNVSARAACFISLNTGSYLSNNGIVLDNVPEAFLMGTVRDVGSGGYTNSCLLPGQSGHFIGITLNVLFDQIDSIEFNDLSVSVASSNSPSSTVSIPGYAVIGTANNSQALELSLHNDGPANVIIGPQSVGILLDTSGKPLVWTYLSRPVKPTVWDGSLSAGADGTLESNIVYEGASTRMLVYLEYDAAIAPAQSLTLQTLDQPLLTVSDFGSLEAYQVYILTQRNEQEKLKALSQ